MGAKDAGGVFGRVRRFARHAVRPFVGGGTGGVLAIALALILLSAWYFGWQKWGARVTGSTRYLLTAKKLVITPRPPWIHTDICGEVMQDGSLRKLSVLDPDLTKQVAHAFELHTWVARVVRVAKRPGPKGAVVQVDLRYREPALMVKTRAGFWPVDTRGVLLQPNDLAPSQTLDYLRLWAGERQPVGPVGTPFGDPVVEGAARIAVVLRGVWKPAGLQWIALRMLERRELLPGELPEYQLLPVQASAVAPESSAMTGAAAGSSVVVVWGHAPGDETTAEARAAEKVARLTQYVEREGALNHPGQQLQIDLRPRTGIAVTSEQPGARAASYRHD